MGAWKKGRLLKGLASSFELPEDVILDLARITIVGDREIFIENHQGILAYGPDRIRIRVKRGEIIITGERLKIDSLLATELVAIGRIEGVQFDRQRE